MGVFAMQLALLTLGFLAHLALVTASAAYGGDSVAGGAVGNESTDWGMPRLSTDSLVQIAQAELSEQEVVLWLQQVLAELGYDPGPIDGGLGAKTRDAIRRYESDSGLPVTGGISENLLDELEASIQASYGGLLAPEQLDELVGPIALYPDELLAIVLPASTFPIDIVQAARFLEAKKQNQGLQPDRKWDASVLGLLNYPEVIQMMSAELEWTQRLGDAVVNQQDDVMEAVQRFRARAYAAGNLEGDDKQVVIREKEIIRIESADPQVIYVPHYQPSTVIVRSYTPAPVVYYYPTPYPVYYSPAATFYTGLFVGAAVGFGLSWHHHRIDIDRNVNINVPGGRPGTTAAWRPHRPPGAPGRAGAPVRPGRAAARPGSRPGGVAMRPGAPGLTRPGARPGPSAGSRPRKPAGIAPAARPGGQSAARPGARAGARPGTSPGGHATFGNAQRGRNAYQDSRRGAQSRSGTRGPSGSPGAGQRPRSDGSAFSGHAGGGNRARAASNWGAQSRQMGGGGRRGRR